MTAGLWWYASQTELTPSGSSRLAQCGVIQTRGDIAVSGIGTITAVKITPRYGSIEPYVAVSMYAMGRFTSHC